MPQSDLAAKQQEEAEMRRRSVDQAATFVVGGDNSARCGLTEMRDGATDRPWRSAGFFEPAEEALETLRVRGFGVRRESRPRGGDGLDFRRVETGRGFTAVRRDDAAERGFDVRVVGLRLLELRCRSREISGSWLGFVVNRMTVWWARASAAVGNAAR
jgi:hypothetical protein